LIYYTTSRDNIIVLSTNRRSIISGRSRSRVRYLPGTVEMAGVDEPVHLQFHASVEPWVQRVPTVVRAGQGGRFDLAERRV